MRAGQFPRLFLAPLLLPVLAAADPVPAASAATVQLRDGRTLHGARIIDSSPGWVTFRSDEGLFKVEVSDLPAGVSAPSQPAPQPASAAAAGMAFERFDPNQEPASEGQPPGAKAATPAAKAQQASAMAPGLDHRGCQIVSFEPKSVQGVEGCASVVISNGTDAGVPLRPGEISCTLEGGGRRQGRFFFSDTFPVYAARREVVPAHGELTVIVTFANAPLAISAVEWSR
jgi:hypothetical protein